MRTLSEKYQRGLELRGERVVPSTVSRYVCMTRAKGGHYFIGHGSLRVCKEGKSYTRSRRCSDEFKAMLVALADAPVP